MHQFPPPWLHRCPSAFCSTLYSVILLPFNQPDPQGLHHWSLTFTHQFSQISRSRNAHSGMQLLTSGISFRHIFAFHLQVLSHLSLIHIMDQSVTCLMVHFILVLKLIFSSSPFLPMSVSSFNHWSAGTFNCPLCGRMWRFKCRLIYLLTYNCYGLDPAAGTREPTKQKVVLRFRRHSSVASWRPIRGFKKDVGHRLQPISTYYSCLLARQRRLLDGMWRWYTQAA